MINTLNTYLKQTQRFIHDAEQRQVNPEDLIDYVNRARREIAMRAQCLRVLAPISGSIKAAVVTSGGTGYTDPVVVITPPDFPSGTPPYPNGQQAIATATALGGIIVSVNIEFGGFGYFEPEITITDPTGTGAVIAPVLTGMNQTSEGQEVYPFSDVDLSANPGVDSIYSVRSVSMIYANYRYSLPCYSFSTYQAYIRQYPFQYQYVPTMCAQFGQGAGGSFMMYPIPSQPYQMEWDAFCIPSELTDDNSFEALPIPWTEAVPHFAAYLAYLEMQSMNNAKMHLELFDTFMKRYSGYARPGRISNPYGRW